MTYVGNRRVIDADSHLMEWPRFLADHADASIRARLPPITGGSGGLDVTVGSHTAAERAALEALGGRLIKAGPKWHPALGAIDPAERSTALDLLGFEHQVVFSSLCAGLFDLDDPEVRYGAYRAHNRAMAAFCAGDPRLSGVALADLDDIDRAVVELDAAADLGLRLVWLPARPPGGRSPGHRDHDPFWARLAERRIPFVLHVGSGPLHIAAEWMNDGRPPGEQMTGAEIINAKDFTTVHHTAQRFLGVLVLDGVLERHPDLHGGAIEIGAGWVPDFLRRLDHAVSIWSRSEPRLATFARTPTEQAVAQLRFTPYPFEDVGRFVAETDPRLYLFSSDYPHAEGGRDPLGRFERSMATAGPAATERFLAGNAAEWLRLPA